MWVWDGAAGVLSRRFQGEAQVIWSVGFRHGLQEIFIL